MALCSILPYFKSLIQFYSFLVSAYSCFFPVFQFYLQVTLKSCAFRDSTKRSMRFYLRSYLLFFEYFHFTPFPEISLFTLFSVFFLSRSLSSHRSVINYLSIVHLSTALLVPVLPFCKIMMFILPKELCVRS